MSDRRQLIASLLDRRPVTSQPQLVELLAGQGVHVTQATVSRDLERLGAVRVRKDGHLVYALPVEDEPADPATRLREALRLVRGMESSGKPGRAQDGARRTPCRSRAHSTSPSCPRWPARSPGDDVVLVIAREPSTGADVLDLCDRIGAEAAHANV